MLEKVEGYGYRNIGFILDRGYFSEADIHYMDNHSYGFVIMVKGMACKGEDGCHRQGAGSLWIFLHNNIKKDDGG